MSSVGQWLGRFVCLACLCLTTTSSIAVVYDANTDLFNSEMGTSPSPTFNAWSLGYRTATSGVAGDQLTPYNYRDTSGSDGYFHSWSINGSTYNLPQTIINTADNYRCPLSAHEISLVPSMTNGWGTDYSLLNNSYNVLRWTAPHNGIINISTNLSNNLGNANADVHLVAGTSTLWNTIVNPTAVNQQVSGLVVTAGERVDLIVGNNGVNPPNGVGVYHSIDFTPIGLPSASSKARVGVSINIGSPLQAAEMDLLRDSGCGLARSDIKWEYVEATKGNYNFSFFDELHSACETRGIRNLFILDYTNWNYDQNPSTDPYSSEWRKAFVNYATAVAAHFSGSGNLYEVWNEPDNWPNPGMGDPAAYTALATAVSAAMKAADPTCTVIGPAVSNVSGNANGGGAWLQDCYENGLLPAVDAVSVHTYNGVQPPEFFVLPSQTYQGVTKPIVASEWGVTTTDGIPAKLQGDYLARYNLVNMQQGVPFSVWFNWKDGTNPNDREQNFGMVTADLTPKPAYYSMQRLTSAISDKAFTTRLSSDSQDWLLTFTNPNDTNKKALAGWTARTTWGYSLDSAPIIVTVPDWGAYLLTGSPCYVNQNQTRTNGSGNWYDNSWAGSTAWIEGSQATFSASGSTVTVNGSPSVSAIQFANSGYTLNGGTLNLVGGGGNINTATYDVTINSVLAGRSDLRKVGTGQLTLGGTNTFIGSVYVGAGTLKVGNGHALGDFGNDITVLAGGTLDLNGQSLADYCQPITINGAGINSVGALVNSSASNAGSANLAVVLDSDSSIGVTGTGVLTVGSVSGTHSLTKAGSGTLVIAGVCTYTGSTTINAGTLKINGANLLPDNTAITLSTSGVLDINGFNETVGSLSGSGGTVSLGTGALTLNNRSSTTFAGAITGAGGKLIKQGSGQLTLSGTNTYTGGTTINAGALRFSTSGTCPAGADSITINSGGTLVADGAYSNAANWLNSGKISEASTGTLAMAANMTSGTLNMAGYDNLYLGATGAYNLGSGVTFTPAGSTYRLGGGGGTLTVSKALTGSRNLVVAGNVTLNATNTYTGGTDVWGGNLKFNSTSAIPSTGTALIHDHGAVLIAGAYTTAQSWLNSGKINTGSTGALAFTANNSSAISMGNYTGLSIGANGAYTYSGTLTPASSTFRFGGGGGTLTVSSALNGANRLVTAGNVTLTGTNGFSGETLVNAGTLRISGSGSINATSGITLNGGALIQNSSIALDRVVTVNSGTVGGTGTYNGSLSLSDYGRLSPGDGGVGTLTVAGDVSLSSGSVLDFDFGTAANTCDLVAFSGGGHNLVLDGTINISCTGTLQSGTYTIFSGAANITDNGLDFGTLAGSHNWTYYVSAGSVYVVAAPEPSAMILSIVGLLGLTVHGVWKRRRQCLCLSGLPISRQA